MHNRPFLIFKHKKKCRNNHIPTQLTQQKKQIALKGRNLTPMGAAH